MIKFIYSLLISFSLILFSCGGGGGSSENSGAENPISYPQPQKVCLCFISTLGFVGFQVDFSVTGNINPQDLKIEKGNIIKNWDIEEKLVDGKLRIIAFNNELNPVFSNKKEELLKIYIPTGVEISKISEKFVNDTGVPVKIQTVLEKETQN